MSELMRLDATDGKVNGTFFGKPIFGSETYLGRPFGDSSKAAFVNTVTNTMAMCTLSGGLGPMGDHHARVFGSGQPYFNPGPVASTKSGADIMVPRINAYIQGQNQAPCCDPPVSGSPWNAAIFGGMGRPMFPGRGLF
eukprot:TRINITY_DN28589_c0_g1_i1.p1 TRINITY_DN28589_c0_g1~~TRINITY_DN28589_c0_g1_i1.p1  ORF type:complete len:138 (-),score=15.83 TRINITY_DN28589_c0_g1_i1:198-611(-)